MPKYNPLVTVYMPTYNRSDLLSRAIESVQDQTYSNFELIIVDDCSTDNTEAVVQAYKDRDSRIKYIKNSENLGACASRNKAIRAAQGEFITGLDDDDYFLPDRLERFIKAWHLLPEDKVLVFSDYYYRINNELVEGDNYRKFHKSKKIVKKDMMIRNFIGGQVFAKKNVVQSTSLFDENLIMWQDYEFFYRVLDLGSAYLVSGRSYVIDQNHNMGRISEAKADKLVSTYNYFCKKHKLAYLDRQLVRNFLSFYDERSIEFIPSFVSLVYYPSRVAAKNILKSIKSSFNRTLHK